MAWLPPLTVLNATNLRGLVTAFYGFSSCVSLADITDEHGQEHQVYIKAFPKAGDFLVGEVLLWGLSKLRDLECPDQAWLMVIPATMLKSLYREVDWLKEWGEEVPCFVTSSLIADAPPQTCSAPVETEELRKWSQLDEAIALVEWLANADANLGNLVRLPWPGGVTYGLIDGGCCLGLSESNPRLDEPHLDKLRPTRAGEAIYNKLADAVYGVPLASKEAISVMNAAKAHERLLKDADEFLTKELSRILGDASLVLVVMRLLRERASLSWLTRNTHAQYGSFSLSLTA
ncbi:hypothetical protein ACUHMQ_16690 [Chitinimonas sp. PSY-7]|uniref:hypothetical protein n=1 Tax=Chitinimonas sp. PSY-7 TaxID=3459088 RepID=UPI0040401577